MPFSPFGPAGNLLASVTQRPYWSTSGPWLPGHLYQKSSMLTFVYPTPANPLFFIASAVASMFCAVGLCRMKLQLLHPSGGLSPTPLSSAPAGAEPATTPAIRNAAAVTTTVHKL